MSFQLFLQNQSQEQQKFKESTVTHSVEVHEYIGNTFIEDDEERTPKALRTVINKYINIYIYRNNLMQQRLGIRSPFWRECLRLIVYQKYQKMPSPINQQSFHYNPRTQYVRISLLTQMFRNSYSYSYLQMPMTESEYKNIAVETNYDEEVEVTY